MINRYSLIAVIIFLLLPLVISSPYIYTLMILTGIFSLLAIGLNLMFGYAGIISFGHAAFFAIGAYMSGILTERLGWSLLATLPFVIAGAAICGLVLGLATIRIGGIYFAIASLAFAEIVRIVALNWMDLTNGPMGLVLNPGSLHLIGNVPLQDEMSFYYLILATVLISLFVIYRMQMSRFGRALLSIRENEALASSVGVSPLIVKVAVISVGGILAAIGGSYYGYYYGLVTPEVASVHYTTIALLAVMVGGRGTLFGPIAGACIFTLVPEFIPGSLSDLIFGVILLAVILLAPGGMAPVISRLFRNGGNKHKRSGMGNNEGLKPEA